MLSRVAERIYWMSRYMERAENTARLINVNTNLLLDLPIGSKVSWLTLLEIIGCDFPDDTRKKVATAQEQAAMKLLISDQNSFGSIINCLRNARENARTSREIIPAECWELINDLYLYVKENASKKTARASRRVFLQHIIATSQQFSGLLAGTMSHTEAYEFIRLGGNLERSDMTSRIVDAGALNLMENIQQANMTDSADDPFSNILWMSVLQSLSAYQMYRQHVFQKVSGEEVVNFLLQNTYFPRAVSCCLKSIKESLSQLPHHDEPLHTLATIQRKIDQVSVSELLEKQTLHDFIDGLQLDFANIHQAINDTWFLPQLSVPEE